MARIDPITEQKIKDAANIMDVMEDLGVTLHRCGASYEGLCPFYPDHHLGSFKVSESKNIATSFSMGKTWNPIEALMEGRHLSYNQALRYLAALYHIIIDDEPVPVIKPAKPREKSSELKMVWWNVKDIVKPYLGHADQNPLLRYLYSLPLYEKDMENLKFMAEGAYLVGTSLKGSTAGWTIWWQIDECMRVRTGKLMAYKEDGHRDKELKYSFNFVHAMLAKAGRWDTKQKEYRSCLFGLHLVDVFKDAEICIVESEKSALICSAFTDPYKRLWMATAGKSQLTRKQLQPLIDRKRWIVLYPDYDGYEEWEAAVKRIKYERLSISPQVKDLHIEADGDKADIADIMLRLVSAPVETEAEKASRRVGHPEKADVIGDMMDKLNLKLLD